MSSKSKFPRTEISTKLRTDDQIGVLNRSQVSLEKTKTDLVVERQALLQELKQVDWEITDLDKSLSQIPMSITKLKIGQEEIHSSSLSAPEKHSTDSGFC